MPPIHCKRTKFNFVFVDIGGVKWCCTGRWILSRTLLVGSRTWWLHSLHCVRRSINCAETVSTASGRRLRYAQWSRIRFKLVGGCRRTKATGKQSILRTTNILCPLCAALKSKWKESKNINSFFPRSPVLLLMQCNFHNHRFLRAIIICASVKNPTSKWFWTIGRRWHWH